jgi:hypothetical protein
MESNRSFKYCKVCGTEIPVGRVKLGYVTTCVNHSSAERYTAFISANQKTDYETHIVRDPEVASRMAKLSQRDTYL